MACADALKLIPARAWQRMLAGTGSKGARDYDWALLEVVADDTLAGQADTGASVQLARSHRYTRTVSYFRCWTPATLGAFLRTWDDHQAASRGRRLVVLPTADHDFSRLGRAAELGAAFAFLLTWGSIPSINYGYEIGMRYLTGLPDHEGSTWRPGFNRAGCRTPVQWDPALPNAGFSTAPAERLYLPRTPARTARPSRPTAPTQPRP